MATKLRMGMVGGGEGAFIGPVHRIAAELDGRIELVCGAFSADPHRSVRSGTTIYGLPEARCYADYESLFRGEASLPAGERMDFVSVVTPNHLHVPVAKAALAAGFPVVCDKPLSHRLADALALEQAVAASGLPFALTHNYTGYPLVKEARSLVADGAIGPVRRVVCEYLQGWLAGAEERSGNKQADWRTDPARAGAAGCMGDIGSHCQNLIEFVTGLEITTVCAELNTFVPGRRVDDDGNVLLRLAGGARGALLASQVAFGEENALRLRVYGERGGLDWSQQEPNSLLLRRRGSFEVRRTGGPGLGAPALAAARLPAGHPEGYLEAFANLYRAFADAVRSQGDGSGRVADIPGVADGVRGMRFLDAVVASSRVGGAWCPV